MMTDPILEWTECPIIVMRPPTLAASIVVGVSVESPIGPRVVMGTTMQGHCFAAHMEPEVALAMADKLRDAALDLMAMRATE